MIDNIWLIISALLVFIMQAGFLCFETGRTRSKNNINVAAKNIIDFIVSTALFWLVGFGLMFGSSYMGVVGTSDYLFNGKDSAYYIAFFLFQLMFCGTAATLTSGAVAERMSFIGYVYLTIILSLVIYPIVGHWAWAGLFNEHNKGWLESLGFIDFAGSTVVHSVGAWVGLAAILIIGARKGRFNKDKTFPIGSNLPMATLGVLLIWFGWFGFNGGSVLAFNETVPQILLNTLLSAIWGGIAASCLNYYFDRYLNVGDCLNGIIAGLVGITASCHLVDAPEAVFIGFVSGVLMYFGTLWLEKLKIDDALGVIPAHLFAGIWGTLAVALFGNTALGVFDQLKIQLLGIVVIGLYSFVLSYVLLRIVNGFIPLRVSKDDENIGLNITEHRANTELIDLLTEMEVQQNQGDFTGTVKEEPFTEVGQIAKKYNQVISRVTSEMNKRDHAIAQFRNSEKRKSAILDSSMDCIITIDLIGHIIEFNPAAERTFNILKKQILGENFVDYFILTKDKKEISNSIKHAFSSGNGLILNRRKNLVLKRASGEIFPAEITITSTSLGHKSQDEFTLHIRDVAKNMKLQSRLEFLAYKDPLTGLSNRTHMMKQLHAMIAFAKKNEIDIALFFLDLDKFKKINDTLGHHAGDELLCEVAARLNIISRDNDIIARWGGDEFVFIIAGKLDHQVISSKAKDILAQMRKAIWISQKEYTIPTSIGIALSPIGYVNADDMIQRADIAMYKAKELGRDNYQIYDDAMGKQAAKILDDEHEIKQGLEKGQFTLVYQPKVQAIKNNIVGLEALIRWHHPDKGDIFPNDFIPVAEESDLIIALGEFVIMQALKQQRLWADQGTTLIPISVNISGRHILSDQFLTYLSDLLSLYQIEGKYLEIEITERVLIKDIEQCIAVLTEVKALGVIVSIDDFGTGYSSLNYLKRLPIDTLKIDRSFVQECDQVAEDREICSAIINLAAGMKLATIAEGVETLEQANTLCVLGCNVYQGYYFYKPLSVKQLVPLANKNWHIN